MTLLSGDYFNPGDWRNLLKGWIKENCLYPVREYRKIEVVKYHLMEFLSQKLVDRKKGGLLGSMIGDKIRKCGKTGEAQVHKKTRERRYVGHYCNQRGFHLPCSIRYRTGQGVEMKNQYVEIAKSKKLWGFYSWTFTLPQNVRVWIDQNPEKSKIFLTEVRRAIAKTIKEALGLNTKSRGKQPGFSIMYHPCSSGDPFKQSSHFHAMILPVLADLKKHVTLKFNCRFNHAEVKRIFKKHLDKVLVAAGIPLDDLYVVHLRDIFLDHPSGVSHSFKYNNRSQVSDILKRIKRVHTDDPKTFGECVCLLIDKKGKKLFPVVKSLEEILDALEFVLNPVIPIRTSYGFMRVIDKYSKLLGIERETYEEDSNWETLFPVQIFRVLRNLFIDGKVKTFVDVFIRERDGPLEWIKVKPEELRGERTCMSGRKLYKCKA